MGLAWELESDSERATSAMLRGHDGRRVCAALFFGGLGSQDWKGMTMNYLLYNLYESILSLNKSV